MPRPSRDEVYLQMARSLSLRATCIRRKVGCILSDYSGIILAVGYNGVASGRPHCTSCPCPGAGLPSGTGLDACEAIHAEANALLRCSDIRMVHTAYVTASPCIHCTKLLLNSNCRRIVSGEAYAHEEKAKELWTRGAGREWITLGG